MTQLANSTFKVKYRSPLEEKVAKQLEKAGVPFVYEGAKLEYKVPARRAKYTPDFTFDYSKTPIMIETKGWFRTAAERHKMVLVKECNPSLDIRIVFQNANKPIYKGSRTTYAMWAEENDFLWADKGTVPEEWIKEITNGVQGNVH
jgi:hypothetical protein